MKRAKIWLICPYFFRYILCFCDHFENVVGKPETPYFQYILFSPQSFLSSMKFCKRLVTDSEIFAICIVVHLKAKS